MLCSFRECMLGCRQRYMIWYSIQIKLSNNYYVRSLSSDRVNIWIWPVNRNLTYNETMWNQPHLLDLFGWYKSSVVNFYDTTEDHELVVSQNSETSGLFCGRIGKVFMGKLLNLRGLICFVGGCNDHMRRVPKIPGVPQGQKKAPIFLLQTFHKVILITI